MTYMVSITTARLLQKLLFSWSRSQSKPPSSPKFQPLPMSLWNRWQSIEACSYAASAAHRIPSRQRSFVCTCTNIAWSAEEPCHRLFYSLSLFRFTDIPFPYLTLRLGPTGQQCDFPTILFHIFHAIGGASCEFHPVVVPPGADTTLPRAPLLHTASYCPTPSKYTYTRNIPIALYRSRSHVTSPALCDVFSLRLGSMPWVSCEGKYPHLENIVPMSCICMHAMPVHDYTLCHSHRHLSQLLKATAPDLYTSTTLLHYPYRLIH